MDAIDEDEAVDSIKTTDSIWNIKGLKKEVARLILRSHKKIGKVHTKVRNAQAQIDKLTTSDPTLEQLEQCPNIDAIQFELEELQSRLQKLNELEECLQKETKKEATLAPNVAQLALDLGVDDQPPPRPERGPKKAKGPRVMDASRLPYRRFYTENKTEIRVSSNEPCGNLEFVSTLLVLTS